MRLDLGISGAQIQQSDCVSLFVMFAQGSPRYISNITATGITGTSTYTQVVIGRAVMKKRRCACNQRGDARIRIGVTHTFLATSLRVHDHHRGGVPGEGAVRLRPVGGNTVG